MFVYSNKAGSSLVETYDSDMIFVMALECP